MNDLSTIIKAVAHQNFVVLDTETTGLHDGEIIEIAIVDHQGEVLMDQRIKPVRGIPAQATAIHGITLEHLTDCPTFVEVVERIKEHLTGKDVIVYNAIYDRKMLHQSAEKAGLEKVDWKSFSNWICAMSAFAPIFGERKGYRTYKWKPLTTAARYYGGPVQDAHSALGDCLMTLGVVNAMAKKQPQGDKQDENNSVIE
jgi:DNA polymerase-3 subunit epsilon